MAFSIFLNSALSRWPLLSTSYMSNISLILSSGEPLAKITIMSRNSLKEMKPLPSWSISWNIWSTNRESGLRDMASANSVLVSSQSRITRLLSELEELECPLDPSRNTDLKKFSRRFCLCFLVKTLLIMTFF